MPLSRVEQLGSTEDIPESKNGSRVARLSPRKKKQVEELIDQGIGDGVRLADLATLMGYSRDYFWRMFKKTFEQSPYQYILSRRVARAKILLLDRSIPLASVALSCGFANQGHFTKIFKQQAGCTPGAFRKRAPPQPSQGTLAEAVPLGATHSNNVGEAPTGT